jgi:hypothetical protein
MRSVPVQRRLKAVDFEANEATCPYVLEASIAKER